MIQWESEFKKFLAKKFNEFIEDEDFYITPNNIETVEFNLEIDITLLSEDDLLHIYSFSIMKEDFEYAKKIDTELKKRGFIIKMDTDDKNRKGSINMYNKSNDTAPVCSVPILLFPDGIMIDFENDIFS